MLEEKEARGWLGNKPFVPRNVMMFVLCCDREMSTELMDSLKSVFEHEVQKLSGLQVGSKVYLQNIDGKFKFNKVPLDQAVKLTYVEKFDSSISNAFSIWYEQHIAGRTPEDLRNNGVDILFIEPDATHKHVDNVWYLNGAWPKTTGSREATRDLLNQRPEVPVFEIELGGTIFYNQEHHFKIAEKILERRMQDIPSN